MINILGGACMKRGTGNSNDRVCVVNGVETKISCDHQYGVCMNRNGKTRCICSLGHYGLKCDKTTCPSSMDYCNTHGTKTHSCEDNERVCTCKDGYYGDRCILKKCTDDSNCGDDSGTNNPKTCTQLTCDSMSTYRYLISAFDSQYPKWCTETDRDSDDNEPQTEHPIKVCLAESDKIAFGLVQNKEIDTTIRQIKPGKTPNELPALVLLDHVPEASMLVFRQDIDGNICQLGDFKKDLIFPRCQCDTGRWGTYCQYNLVTTKGYCKNGKPNNDPVNSKCVCNKGYSGHDCSVPICASPGYCVNGWCNIHSLVPLCVCNPGYKGEKCHQRYTKDDYCKNGVYTPSADIPCHCEPLYAGSKCEIYLDPSKYGCYNNGAVIPVRGEGFKCDCKHGYEGWQCEKKIHLNPEFCGEGFSSVEGTNVECKCPRGRKGLRCQEYRCIKEDSNGIIEDLCQNGGKCVIEPYDSYCKCDKNHEGEFCEYKRSLDCVHGKPHFSESGIVECICDEGFTGELCQNLAIKPSSCFHPTYSMLFDGRIKCKCPKGWDGEFCQNSMCLSHNGVSMCEHGVCKAEIGKQSECVCDPLWKGEYCSLSKCDSLNYCEHGYCSKSNGEAFCECWPGWEGQKCNVPKCQNPNNCINGECIGDVNPVCSCYDGWTGKECNMPTCENYPHCGQGKCVIFGDESHRCECDRKTHDGAFCQYRCLKACLHGECMYSQGRTRCICSSGYTGDDCSEII